VILLPIIFPSAAERMLYGIGRTDAAGQAVTDEYELTSGRNLIWPHVIDKIAESRIVGHGRLAMRRTNLADKMMDELGESFPHPHNMYLETLLDNGLLGSIPIFLFWMVTFIYSARLFRYDDPLCSAVGGLSLSLMTVQLIAGLGAQHFYPRESTMCVWAAMLLSLRVYVGMKQAQTLVSVDPVFWNRRAVEAQEEVPVQVRTYEMVSQ